MALFKAIREYRNTIHEYSEINKGEIVKLLNDSFIRVISTIYSNKDPKFDEKTTYDIIEEALQKGSVCYDLNTETFSDKIINSVRTDIEILRGAISIVGTIMSANQYIASEVKMDNNK